ncbi:MBL fold metallo-hydrolase [Cellulosimicrobium marinum]|uniref:MBL fold metallo-hydrolase n=1 Tax=Cellulosimicrobium marinum TaxID=1638992 RepID=UPI001E5B49C9|nr:MBL fold metallo-hydrolase [Cellulosimicrobium marinum]MCB7137602.1 MBL fold metallo-hydrolase [Cellulosimicrobium marinum]
MDAATTDDGSHEDGSTGSEVRVEVVVAPVFGTNCAVVSAPGGDCVVVDPGAGVADDVVALVRRRGLVPRAVLATHGHVDHTWDAAVLGERLGVPFLLHAADAYRLEDPFGTLERHGAPRAGADGPVVSGPLGAALRAAGARPEDYRRPDDVTTFDAGPGAERVLRHGGLVLRAVGAPGHTEGSTLYLVGEPGRGVVLSGDVLFAGSVGRTDLPGGDGVTMAATLRDVVGRLDPGWDVLPGHGPATSVARELATNPFLAA